MRGKMADDTVTALPVSTGLIAGNGATWFPYADGIDLPDQPEKLLEAGSFAKVPVILGTNKNEGTLFFALGVSVPDDATYQTLMGSIFGAPNAAAIVAQYPSKTYGTPKDAAAEAFGDGAFVCPTRRAARALAKGGTSAYLYHFVHAVTSGLFSGLGVYHSSELPFVWGNPYLGIMLDASEQGLSADFRGFWTSMAKTGSPGSQAGVAWAAYDPAADENLVLDLQLSTTTGLKKANCDFWDGLTP
jgi:para-nitrobenzyl esterase